MVLQKLGSCLTNWHPSDASARSVLMPWRTIFPVTSMAAFLSRHVVPKLALALQQFQVSFYSFIYNSLALTSFLI
ncbi:unnamed protein product [Schistosoma curassoni]|uniref:GCFC domain-containing protein n=1 Tax=Schistosoma curassoni TaxID=6186 RepID=A0A183L489_9TREM|nr:unnamed protein product [Schistosoma curassoni]